MGNTTAQLDVAVSFCVVQALRAFQVHACSGNFQATGKRGGRGENCTCGKFGKLRCGRGLFFLVTLRDQFRTLGAISFRLLFLPACFPGNQNLVRQYLSIENVPLTYVTHIRRRPSPFSIFSWWKIAIFLDVSATIKHLKEEAGFFNAESADGIED